MNQTTTAPLIRILKTATCPNLSNSAKLGYQIGCNAESKILLHVFSNSGSGYFSREWVSLDAVFKALDKCPKDKPLTAFWLHPLLVGKSINTPSFLMAVLLAEGLVQKAERNYERCDHKGFVSDVNKLIESGVDIKVEVNAKVEAKPKVVTKAKAASPIKKATRKELDRATTKAK
ncbi:MAG: hypothetical protein WA146_00740 [Thiobacillus sp.]